MDDVLAGGILERKQSTNLAVLRPYTRRRRSGRSRSCKRPLSTAPQSRVQPGQLASPHMKFGFPSLALH